MKFILILNKQCQPRLLRYMNRFPQLSIHARKELLQMCMSRCSANQASFFDYNDIRIVFKQQWNLYIIAGIDTNENELATLQFMQFYIDILEKYFGKISELDLMFNMDKVGMILDEMVQMGHVVDCNPGQILAPIRAMDNEAKT